LDNLNHISSTRNPLIKALSYLSVVFFFLLGMQVQAQDPLERKISFEASSERLTDVLDRLSATEKINFSYNPAEPSFSTIIDYKAAGKPLRVVLEDVLAMSGNNFRLVGNQVVIYAINNTANTADEPTLTDQDEVPEPLPPRANVANQQEIAKDTVFIYDESIVHDTIFLTDTLIIRDTVFIREEARPVKPEHPKPLREGMFRTEPDRNNGWFLTTYYTHMWASSILSAAESAGELLHLVEESENTSWSNATYGVEITRSKQQFQFGSGLQFTKFSQPFQYRYEEVEGGFFVTDTIESYYLVSQNDTTWYYFTDSTWIPRDSREFFLNRRNQISYLELPLMAGFNIYSSQNLNIYLKGGLYLGLLINKSGNAIKNGNGYPGIDFKELEFNPLVMSYLLGGGIRYRIYKWFDINAELGYRRHVIPVIKNYPVEKRISAAGLKVGFIYYL
jgi:hypothetical protein